MDRDQSLLLVGILMLTLGFLFPWVVFDSLATRRENLEKTITLLSDPRIPGVLVTQLEAYRLRPNMSPEELWATLGGETHSANFKALESAERLFSWQFLLLNAALWAKLTIILVFLCYLATISLFLSTLRTGHTHIPLYVVFILSIVVLLLFSFQLPFFDSLGYSGDWNMALMDALSGARVTFAPRTLVPLGLVFLALAGVEDFAQKRPRRSKESSYSYNEINTYSN